MTASAAEITARFVLLSHIENHALFYCWSRGGGRRFRGTRACRRAPNFCFLRPGQARSCCGLCCFRNPKRRPASRPRAIAPVGHLAAHRDFMVPARPSSCVHHARASLDLTPICDPGLVLAIMRATSPAFAAHTNDVSMVTPSGHVASHLPAMRSRYRMIRVVMVVAPVPRTMQRYSRDGT